MQNARIEVEDRDGWRKTFAIQKAITHIGAEARNDIVLESWRGAGVAPRHAQLIGAGATWRLVNLGNAEVSVAAVPDGAPAPVAPMSSVELQDGAQIKLGEFRLWFFGLPDLSLGALSALESSDGVAAGHVGGVAAGAGPRIGDTAGDAIGLRLRLSGTGLSPDRPLEGAVIVRNQGSRAGAQFRIEVKGLDADMFEIGPGPILFPNAEKEVAFRIRHTRKPRPPAGDVTVVIRATAPDAYPGQSAMVTQTIQVLPHYSHSLTVTALDSAVEQGATAEPYERA